MVAVADAVQVLFPNSVPLTDWVVSQTKTGASITFWRTAIGTQPTQAQLDAVTQAQLDAYRLGLIRASAVAVFMTNHDNAAVVLRGVVMTLIDEINILRAAIPHPITSITRATTVATATCPVAHGLSVGSAFSVAGSDIAAYNVTGTVATVPSSTTFTYAVAGSPATPATGSLVYTLGAVPATQARTGAQAQTAVQAKINGGTVD